MLYKFNSETLDYEPVSLKPLLALPIVVVVALIFRLFYFNAEICEITNFRGEKEKCTISEYFKEKQRIASYDKKD